MKRRAGIPFTKRAKFSQKAERKRPQKLGQFLNCSPETLREALAWQARLASQGIRKRLGAILIEMQAVSPKELTSAVHRQRLERLKNCFVFSDVSERELEALTPFVQEKSLKVGDEFIHQEGMGDCFYIVVQGEVLVFWVDEDQEEIPLATVGAGECIGEMGYFSGRRRSASVRALEDAELLQIDYTDLQTSAGLSKALMRKFLDVVTSRLRQTNRNFVRAVQKASVLERAQQSVDSLLDLSAFFKGGSDVEGLIQRVVFTASRVMNAERASLFLLNEMEDELWSKVVQGEEKLDLRIPVGKGIAGWVALHDQTLNIADAYSDPRFNPEVDQKTGYRTRSILCRTVKNLQGQTVGVIQVINKKNGNFGKQDEKVLQALAYQTAMAVENFALHQKAMESSKRRAILLDVAASVSQTLDLDFLIDKIIAKISEILGTERTSLFLVDAETDELWSKAAQGAEGTEIRFSRNTGLAGYVSRTGEILNIPDAYQDSRFNAAFDKLTRFRTRNVLAAPVVNREGEISGVIQAMNKKEGRFKEEDENLLALLACQIAVAIENAQLYQSTVEIRNYLESIRQSISSGIITLDNSYRIVTANRAALKLFNVEADAILQQDIRQLIGSGDDRLLGYLKRVYRTHRSVVDYDVDLRWHELNLTVNLNFLPLVDHRGERQGLVLVFEDISQEKRARSTLSRYVAKDIVDKVLSDPQRQVLGGVRSKATVLFADIRNFTHLVDSLDAEQAVDFLNEYFTHMGEAISRHRGVLDKYIGDGLMAVFGIPFVQEDDALRAGQAALAMKRELARLNSRRSHQNLLPLEIGIGVSTAEVVQGNIGSERRMDFTVVGDGVNVAARLQSLNKTYKATVLISGTTHQEIQDHFLIRPIDRVLLQGRQEPIQVFEVLGNRHHHLSRAEEHYFRGFEAYSRGDYRTARKYFSRAAKKDRLSSLFARRCREFMQCPPPADWNGVWLWEQRQLVLPPSGVAPPGTGSRPG